MPHIRIECKDLKTHHGIINQRNNKILLSDEANFSCVSALETILEEYTDTELSLLISMKSELSSDFIELCRKHRLIVYLEFCNNISSWSMKMFEGIDLVLIVCYTQLNDLSNEEIKYIIDANFNICVTDINGELQEIEYLYKKLLDMGFSKLFHLAYKMANDIYGEVFYGLIDRSGLETFACKQNFEVANQIALLQKNALKRLNRSRTANKVEKENIILIDLECGVYSFGRKNLGIEYLSSVLKAATFKVMTQYYNRYTFIKEFETMYKSNAVQVVGFSCMQDNYHAIKNAIRYIKINHPEIVCFIGGAQAVALGEEFLRETEADYIMVGESENCIVDLMNYVMHHKGNLENIGNIRYINEKDNYIENPKVELISNLDEIPFPAYVFEVDDRMIATGVITGRGCPYKCAFCFEGAKEKTVRYRSVSNVMEEISTIIKNKKNVKRIQFYDDTFTLNVQRTLEFCNHMKELKTNYGINWVCEIHCQTVYNKPELIQTMVDSGMKSAQIGLESGNNSVLKRLNKQTTLEMIVKTVENCKLANLYMLEGNIMLGGAGETREELEYNLVFAKQLLDIGRGMFELNVVPFWPFEHTPISRNPETYGVKILLDQCENSVFSITNFVSESESVLRQEFIEHYQLLNKEIDDIYREMALKLTVEEAQKHQIDGHFLLETKWGRALSSHSHIVTYFMARKKIGEIAIVDTVIPIRTFDMLIYRDKKLCMPGLNITFDNLDSRILECSNGKNTIRDIATKLKIGCENLINRLETLEKRMYLYFTTL